MSGAAPPEENNLRRPLGDGVIPETVVVRTEGRWFLATNAALLVMTLTMTVTAAIWNVHPPSSDQFADPAAAYRSAEFSETNLGTAVVGNVATVTMLAQQYSFVPPCVSVPAGMPVRIRITSADVIHGFIVAGTNVNTMVVPGYVSEVRTEFDHPGTYPMPCHEFCGLGHAGMAARVQVLPQAEFPVVGKEERVRCAKE